MIRNSNGSHSHPGTKFTCTFPGTKLENRQSSQRGPFAVEAKMSYLNYKVNCVSMGRSQVMHVNIMRLKKRQVLAHEKIDEESSNEAIP
jgi:hypothetical protein